jgi:hypothetical protein
MPATFDFEQQTVDNIFGNAITTITNFSATYTKGEIITGATLSSTHIVHLGPTPTLTLSAGVAATLNASSNDNAGILTVTAGPLNGTIVVSFIKAYEAGALPIVSLTPASAGAVATPLYVSAQTTSNFTLTISAAVVGAVTVNYSVVGIR